MLAKGDFEEARSLLQSLFKNVATDRTPIRIQIRCGLLVCAAHFSDWIKWDHHMGAISKLIERSDYVDADVALHLYEAGKLAVKATEAQRGRSALVISKGLYLALQREEDADKVSQSIS